MSRLSAIPGFGIDRVAAAAGDDPEVLRLENLDTDLPPAEAAVTATREAVTQNQSNSYLPFTGNLALRKRIAERVTRSSGTHLTAANVVITCGGTEGMLDVLLALTEPGDEVILTDPTYAGMIYRVTLSGAIARLVPFNDTGKEWRLDLDALRAAVSPRTRVVFLMNPSIPSGAVLNREEWDAVTELCERNDLWLVYNAAMERIVFDGRAVIHPAARQGLAERTITIGSASKELRMIGWRTGWVVAPEPVIADIGRVHIYNTVTATGIAQAGVLAALGESDQAFQTCVREWQARRDALTRELSGFSMLPAAGGWSQLLDVGVLGYDSLTASERLLRLGKIAATPMRHWGHRNGDRFVRLVFSREPVDRLAGVRGRVEAALSR
jgi:aspartate/methionine/tyrosine aminotransferase